MRSCRKVGVCVYIYLISIQIIKSVYDVNCPRVAVKKNCKTNKLANLANMFPILLKMIQQYVKKQNDTYFRSDKEIL